ncbi:MAG: porin [Methylococcales bacterium]
MKVIQIKKAISGMAYGMGMLACGSVLAGATFKIDDTKWLSIGAGLRTSFATVEGVAGRNGDKWSTDFGINNIRLYVNGQLHEYIKVEFNTDCADCTDGGDMMILDAIAKFETNDYANLWVGRQLVPSDRAELDGPFYQNTFEFNKTPFYPSDFGSYDAGKFGRDDGINVWGALTADKKLTYVVGVFDGLDGRANADDNLLYAGRVSYNILDVEKNPGYYTSSTYYGKGGDILTVGVAGQYQEDGAGSTATPASFFGTSVDVLFEKVLGNSGVITVEGEYKHFSVDGNDGNTAFDADCFCIFEGNAYTATALYLLPQKVGIGQFQPYIRYTNNEPQNKGNIGFNGLGDPITRRSPTREEFEAGINYIIDGHNASISLMYQYGDIATKGRNYRPDVTGDHVHAIKLGLQIQL